MSVDHYENFPVASVLCPPALRPAIVAIYHFARTADDIADEGTDSAQARLVQLAAYGQALRAAAAGQAVVGQWQGVFSALAVAISRHALPVSLLADLLDAFEQDVRNPVYPDRQAVEDYCRRSAQPIGRLLLHLYGLRETAALQQSDALCSALQLINFWQDLSVDGPRGRCYVPEQDLAACGLSRQALAECRDSPATRRLVQHLCAWAGERLAEGAPLVHRVPGRAGWELRLVVQGGRRVLEKIAAMDHAALLSRPSVGPGDLPLLLLRALRMRGTVA